MITAPIQTMQLTLENVVYTIGIAWNDRVAGWQMTVGDVNGDTLVGSVAMTLDYPLLNGFEVDGLPPGEFYVIDPAGIQKTDPGRTAWDADGEDLRLLYDESA